MQLSEIIAASPPSQADPSRTAAEVMLDGWDLALQFFQTDGPAAHFMFFTVANAGKHGLAQGFIEHLAQLAMLPEDQQQAHIEVMVAQTVQAMTSADGMDAALQIITETRDASEQRAYAERQIGAERKFD